MVQIHPAVSARPARRVSNRFRILWKEEYKGRNPGSEEVLEISKPESSSHFDLTAKFFQKFGNRYNRYWWYSR